MNNHDWTLSPELLDLVELGQAQAVVDVLNAFLRDAKRHLELADQAVQQGNVPELRMHAHSIKGIAASVGFSEFAAAATHLQSLAEQNNLSNATEAVEQLKNQFPLVSESVFAKIGSCQRELSKAQKNY